MSKAKLAAARELIQDKDYDAARVVLETIDDEPVAAKWLEKLPKPKRQQSSLASRILAIALLVVTLFALKLVIDQFNQATGSAARSAGAQLSPVIVGDESTSALTPTISATEVQSMTNQVTMDPGYIQKDDYGDAWAFMVDEGVIVCDSRGRIYMRVGEDIYGMNGLARGVIDQMGWKDIREILRSLRDDTANRV